jgi:hypothetical protein
VNDVPKANIGAMQMSQELDMVNKPPHYTQGGIECIDAIEAATCNLSGIEAFCTGNAIKYLWRWKQKNGIEDLEKAAWYIERLAKVLLKENTNG